MADKSISQQICELCGVETLKDENAYFTGNLGKYPDFENNNNNFVKLFELPFLIKSGVNFTISQVLCESSGFKFSNKETFLIQLLDFINICENFGEYIKQTIRRANWEY